VRKLKKVTKYLYHRSTYLPSIDYSAGLHSNNNPSLSGI